MSTFSKSSRQESRKTLSVFTNGFRNVLRATTACTFSKSFRHLNLQKRSEHGAFCTFCLGNVLRATMASTFSTSQLAKVVRHCGAKHISKFKMYKTPQRRARFDSSTSKSGPKMVCFVHFALEMCFAPQRRALSRQSKLHKSGPTPHVFCSTLTWKCASSHNVVQFFISHLASWLRTRRFSEPTFRPTGATNHCKNTVFRDFPTFSRICIFFLLILSLLTVLTSAFQLSILSEVSLLNFLRLCMHKESVFQ